MLDYLIVGLGVAGVSFCEQLERNGKSFYVVSDSSQQSSLVAGGLYNPVILKRFTMAWRAKEQLEMAMPFYKALEEKLNVRLDYKIPVFRRFASIEEQNLWFEAADKPQLDYFLDTAIKENKNPHIDAPFGYGEVRHTGRIDTTSLLNSYEGYLRSKEGISNENFDFSSLEFAADHLKYKDKKARRIVFAEGYGLVENPYFNYLPLNGTKGELLIIKAPMLKEDKIVKSSAFIVPYGGDNYLLGATYKWKDKTNVPTEESKNELLEKLQLFLKCDFEIVDHMAGIRPTVTDRRPLVGRHPEHENMYVLNGFGSRGVLIAPYASEQLYNHMEKGMDLNPEMDIVRFAKKYGQN